MSTNQINSGERTRPESCARRLGGLRVRGFAPSLLRHFAPRPSAQPVDLTFLTLINLKSSLPNPLISRVCTPFHINQILFFIFLHSRLASALNFPATSTTRPGLGPTPENLIIIRYLSPRKNPTFWRKHLILRALTRISSFLAEKNYHIGISPIQTSPSRNWRTPPPPPLLQLQAAPPTPRRRRSPVNLIGIPSGNSPQHPSKTPAISTISNNFTSPAPKGDVL